MPGWLLPTFKAVSVTFAVSAVATGVQALVDPIGFTKTFGLLLSHNIKADDGAASTASRDRSVTLSYVSLMGVRQLATGLTLLVFAWQSKWTEAATILAIIGVVVAGTDGVYLARGGEASKGRWHAIPGVLIAALAAAVVR